MKKEELDKLKAKYWEGQTSLEEEQKLKDYSWKDEDSSKGNYFTELGKSKVEMKWDFEDFMQEASTESDAKLPGSAPFKLTYFKGWSTEKKLISLAGIAASLLVGYLFIGQRIPDAGNLIDAKEIMAANTVTDIQDKADLFKTDQSLENLETSLMNEGIKNEVAAAPEKSVSTKKQAVAHVHFKRKNSKSVAPKQTTSDQKLASNELYVEVNGVRIYNEEQALALTHTALSLMTSNLKKGAESMQNIKHLKIEI